MSGAGLIVNTVDAACNPPVMAAAVSIAVARCGVLISVLVSFVGNSEEDEQGVGCDGDQPPV